MNVKEVIFGSAMMISGMLLLLVLGAYGLDPSYSKMGMLLMLIAIAMICVGFILGYLGIREK